MTTKTHVRKDAHNTVCGQRLRHATVADAEPASCLVCNPTFKRPPSRTVPRALAEKLFQHLGEVLAAWDRLGPPNFMTRSGESTSIDRARDALAAARSAGLGKGGAP